MFELNFEGFVCGWGHGRRRKGTEGKVDVMFQQREGSQGEWGVRSGSNLNACLRSLAFVFPLWAMGESRGLEEKNDLYFRKRF